MLEEKKKILDYNAFLNERKNARLETRFEKSRKLFFLLSIFLGLAIMAAAYLLSSASRIYRISVFGNNYLKGEDIITLSGLDEEKRFLLCNPMKTAALIKENPLIDECKVRLCDDNVVAIEVKEKKIVGYAYEMGQNVLISDTDERFPIDENNLYIIKKVPLIEGFSKEELVVVEKNFANIDEKMINEISEIHNYPMMKYQNVELIMRDGNYVFTSAYGLDILNMYYEIVSRYDISNNHCYYFEDISGNAYTSVCPWEETEEETKQTEESDIEE